MPDKLVHDFGAGDFAGFFEKSLNERAYLSAGQACGLQTGEHFCGVPEGTTQTQKQSPGARRVRRGNLCEKGASARNLSYDFLKLGGRYPLPGELKQDLNRFADNRPRNTQLFADDADDLVHAPFEKAARAQAASARKMRSIVLVVE